MSGPRASVRTGTLCRDMPRESLVHLPTPLEHAPGLSRALGVNLFIKREDLAGLCVGGNKSRLLEFALGRIRAEGADTLIAYAADQSNKLRDIAAAAARAGMRAVLLLPGARSTSLQGNRLLDDLLGAEVREVGPDLDDAGVLAAEMAVRDDEAARGWRPAVLDRRLDYGIDATVAYVDAAEELASQLAAADLAPEAVFIAAGAGMTVAGLALGMKHLGAPTRVTGVCISRRAADLLPDILWQAGRATAALGLSTPLEAGDLTLDDGQIGAGYGVVTAGLREVIRRYARAHGMVLDPVYNAKVALALVRQVESGMIRPGATVVQVNTGGGPAIFDYAADLMAPDWVRVAEGAA